MCSIPLLVYLCCVKCFPLSVTLLAGMGWRSQTDLTLSSFSPGLLPVSASCTILIGQSSFVLLCVLLCFVLFYDVFNFALFFCFILFCFILFCFFVLICFLFNLVVLFLCCFADVSVPRSSDEVPFGCSHWC